MNQGTLNNLSGLGLEAQILGFCQRLGFAGQARKTFKGIGLAGTDYQLSVWLDRCPLFPKGLAIDASSQESSGTGQNKVGHKIFSIVEGGTNGLGWSFPAVLVLDGNGRGLESRRQWAKDKVGDHWHTRGNWKALIGVYELDEFEAWFARLVRDGRPVVEWVEGDDRFMQPQVNQQVQMQGSLF